MWRKNENMMYEYVVSEKRKRILATIEDETLMIVKHVS